MRVRRFAVTHFFSDVRCLERAMLYTRRSQNDMGALVFDTASYDSTKLLSDAEIGRSIPATARAAISQIAPSLNRRPLTYLETVKTAGS